MSSKYVWLFLSTLGIKLRSSLLRFCIYLIFQRLYLKKLNKVSLPDRLILDFSPISTRPSVVSNPTDWSLSPNLASLYKCGSGISAPIKMEMNLSLVASKSISYKRRKSVVILYQGKFKFSITHAFEISIWDGWKFDDTLISYISWKWLG